MIWVILEWQMKVVPVISHQMQDFVLFHVGLPLNAEEEGGIIKQLMASVHRMARPVHVQVTGEGGPLVITASCALPSVTSSTSL